MKTFIIDDDPISNMITELMLQIEGFSNDITIFESAADAFTALTSKAEIAWPEVIFLDINMPIVDGWQFLDMLQPYEQMIQHKFRVYMLTSSLDPRDMEKTKEYPLLVHGFIQKPIQAENIQEVLQGLTKEVERHR